MEAPPSLGAGYTQDVFEGYWGAAAIACLSYLQQMSHLGVLILAMCTSKCVSTGPWVVFRFNKPIGVEPKSVTHWNRLSHSYSLDLKSHSSSPLIISNNFLIFSFLNVLSGQIVEKVGPFHSKIFQTPKNSWSMNTRLTVTTVAFVVVFVNSMF